MATAVVTGGAGFLGSHLCDHLVAKDLRVICVDNLETGSLQNVEHLRGDSFSFVHHDVTQHLEIEEPVDLVFHLASPASPIDYLRLPLQTLKVGSYGTHNALGLAKFKRARFLLASTSEVYGDPAIHPQPETYWGNVNPIGPRGVYDEAKRYAEALTMAYHRQQGVDTCIVRIFNSILADEQVLYDDGCELRRETVADLAGRLARFGVAAGYVPALAPRATSVLDPGFSPALEYPLEDVSVPAIGDDGMVRLAPAVSLVAHPTSQGCVEITTRYGRSIKVTADHSVFVEGEDGRPVARMAGELEIGDRIAVARRIDVPSRDREVVDMLDVWRFAEGDPWDIQVSALGLGALAWERRHELFGLLAAERRNNGPNWRNGAWTKLIRMRRNDRVPLPIARRVLDVLPARSRLVLTDGKTAGSLPATVAMSDELLWVLGLWVAEGSVHENDSDCFLTICAGEDLLDRASAVFTDELGLHVCRSAPDEARAGAIFVHSKMVLRLMDYLGFDRNRKRIPGWILGLPLERLGLFLEGYREGDGVHSGLKFAEQKRHEFSTVHDELKNDLVVALARFGIVASIGRYESRKGDRVFPFWRLTVANVAPWSPLEWHRGVDQTLNARCTGDVVWAAIREIRTVPATALVYDFCVPGSESFWAGTGVIAHNTYGTRMRPNDGRAIPTFLRQAHANEPLTVFGDGSQTRSFCYVDDLVRGLVLLAESGEHLPVNIGNPQELSLLELAETVIRVTGAKSEIIFEALPVDDPQVRQPDITRARQLLGWEPQVGLEEGLRRVLQPTQQESLSV